MEEERKKKKADFQDEYTRSSNFNNAGEPDKFKVGGDGKLKLTKDKDSKNESDKEKIADTFRKINKEEE